MSAPSHDNSNSSICANILAFVAVALAPEVLAASANNKAVSARSLSAVPVAVDLGLNQGLEFDRCVNISMMVLCNDSVIVEYDGRWLRIPSAPIDMAYGNNGTEQ